MATGRKHGTKLREASAREAIASEQAERRARVLARSRQVAERQIEAMRGGHPDQGKVSTTLSPPTSGRDEG